MFIHRRSRQYGDECTQVRQWTNHSHSHSLSEGLRTDTVTEAAGVSSKQADAREVPPALTGTHHAAAAHVQHTAC